MVGHDGLTRAKSLPNEAEVRVMGWPPVFTRKIVCGALLWPTIVSGK